MITDELIFEIHSLYRKIKSTRKVAKVLGINRKTVQRYIKNPQVKAQQRKSKKSLLDDYKPMIDGFLDEVPDVKAPAVLDRIQQDGFQGQVGIIRSYLREKRKKNQKKSFLRFESTPGQQIQVDWGDFGKISYGKDARRLYMLAAIEGHSRALYIEFTHSQKQEALHQCLFNAFLHFGGTPRNLVVDNMKTAVTERNGNIIRFNDAFLRFLLPFHIEPKACHVRAPYEKGKVERSISYVRQNFSALRKFTSLAEANREAKVWLEEKANCRIHNTTGEKPDCRLDKTALRPIPAGDFDCRESITLKVHNDFSVRFDGNTYTLPPHYIGESLTLKADQERITLYQAQKKVTEHQRCWNRKQRIENPKHVEKAKKMGGKTFEENALALFSSYGSPFKLYLKGLEKTTLSIKNETCRILEMMKLYDLHSVTTAINKAMDHRAFGADYIENILYQEMTPERKEPPVELKDKELQELKPNPLSLEGYNKYMF